MQPFERTSIDHHGLGVKDRIKKIQSGAKKMGHALTWKQAKALYRKAESDEIWVNDQYHVAIDRNPHQPDDWPKVVHLSIKRVDREVIHDWRDLQEIKNLLVGPENEGVELYPAESRMIDSANQYHLWVLLDETIRFPVGFHDGRFVTDKEAGGSRQRPRNQPAEE